MSEFARLKPHIVLIAGGGGYPVLMTDGEDENPRIFNSYKDALLLAENNSMASARGFEIVEWNWLEKEKP